ncbi:alpha/beta hydrolase [Falsiroseomonas tokyonensis]|uniref:Alpha/beta hydrolase n=1 Tax=Falsiroseomonas tokyonensis TaxID=430521 RepID=A0ABV7BTA6_9PROT|nr:alpha/beta hydrolase [Falsiroseomonas tokyonensis]MBU8537710.1 alpha/beta hydrolase [Falsiroseomonas tokyonensis]
MTLDLEAEYNNRARVPDHPRHIAAWQAESAAWREACPAVELALPYGTGARERLDLFWPDATARDAPIALFIHGGYWQGLGREFVSHCARGLNLHGVAVAVPSYDLCPQVTLATIVAQIHAAAAMLHRRHGRRLVASGHSAGGHLAAMLLATDWPALDPALPAGLVQAALPISGVFELDPLRHTSIGVALKLDRAEARRLSPRFLPRPAGALHCVVGGAESGEFIRQSREMAAAWRGGCTLLPGADHFTVLAPMADPDSDVVLRAKQLASAG